MGKPEKSGNCISIPSDTIHLATVDEFVSEKLIQAGISSSSVADIAISVSELVNNAILHGNKSDLNKAVKVEVAISGSELTISIEDQGEGFDPDSIPDPTDQQNLMKKVGRGIYIANSLMDSVEYDFAKGGTRVILKKNIQAD